MELRFRTLAPARRAGVLIAAMILVFSACDTRVQGAVSREYAIKAEFLARLPQFVDWPSQALPESSPVLSVCILGADPFGGNLEAINGRIVKGKRLVVRHVSGAHEARNCHILFVSASERERTEQILDAVGNANVLTVGETKGFARSGGIINFTTEGNKVRFEINPAAAERARLRISSQLLRLARVVRA